MNEIIWDINRIQEEKKKSNFSKIKNNTAKALINNMIQQAYEQKNLTDNEEIQIISQLELLDLEKDRFSKWSEGSIFKIKIKDKNWNIKELIAAKKRYDNDPDNERHIHQETLEIIKKEKLNIKSPELKAVTTLPNWDKFIIMEFIHGKTIYQALLEEILKKRNIEVGDVESDINAEQMFFKALNLNPINKEDCKKASKIYFKEIAWIKLFSPTEGEKHKDDLYKFINSIHDKWIYHRDLSNPRNIIIGEDWTLYVIDFWKSIKTQNKNLSYIYEKQEWDMIWVHPKDEEIIMDVSRHTQNLEDIEFEKERNKTKEQINNIENSKNIINILWNIPNELIKNNNKRSDIEKIVKTQINKKQVKVLEIEECKNNNEILVLLLGQSLENLFVLQKTIKGKIDILNKQILKEEENKTFIPSATIRVWIEAIKVHNNKYDKKIIKIKNQILKLENTLKYMSIIQSKIS